MEEWDGNQKKVCPICRKLPVKGKNDDLCELCKKLRRKGRETGDDIQTQTKFIDEVAWNNSKEDYENVALISAHFDLEKWLNGNFIKTLLIKKVDLMESDLQKLFEEIKKEDLEKALEKLRYIVNLQFKLDKSPEKVSEFESKVYELRNEEITFSELKNVLNDRMIDLETLLIPRLDKKITLEVMKKLKEVKIEKKLDTLENIIHELTGKNNLNIARAWYQNANYFVRRYPQLKSIDAFKLAIISKNSSASRLYRVWNDTKKFFENIEKDICQQVSLVEEAVIELQDIETIEDLYKPKALSEGTLQLEIEVDGRTMKGEGNKKEGNRITVVTPHLTSFIGNKTEIYLIKNGKKYNVKVIDRDRYRQYRKISLSPSLFQFFVPASKSFDFIKLFKIKYEKEFSKVYGKLPLHIGITYFKRKEPIFLILDSSRRFQNMYSDLNSINKMEILSVENITKEDGKIQLELSNKTSNIKININLKRGDENVDWYHPYILVDSCKSKEIIKSPVGDQVHFYELCEKDKVKILPNYFDFEFIDTSAKRFDIMAGQNGKRVHPLFGENGPRPYYLEEIENIEELKKYLLEKEDDFKKKNTISQLHNFRTIIASKVEEWGKEDGALEEFVADSIIHILKIKKSIRKNGNEAKNPNFDFIKNAVLSGMFFDMMEIYHSITKTMEGEK